jgi:rhamnosyltransferase subunit B
MGPLSTPMPRHFILTPFGSAGDVLPFLWIGRLLRARGHAVTLIAAPQSAEAAARAGLGFAPAGETSDYDEVARDPDLWHPWRGMDLTVAYAGQVAANYFQAIEAVRERTRAEVSLVGSFLAFGARLARERFGLPLASVHLQPSIFLSAHETPVLRAHWEWFNGLPRWLKRVFFALPNPVDQKAGPALRAACGQAGVAPPRSFAWDWMHSPDAVLGLFPAWFSLPQPDWPPHCRLAGFPLYDLGDELPLSPATADFLAAGPAPVLFTPGSAMVHGREFFATALAVCRAQGWRAIFATGHRDQLPRGLPPSILAVAYEPFSRLLPRTAAIVHHGGIGTLSQALAAGVPQLVMPMAHDQPDNAHRLVRLGVARRLYPKAFTAENVAAALRALTDDPTVRAACAAAAALIRASRPAEVVIEVLENLHRTK